MRKFMLISVLLLSILVDHQAQGIRLVKGYLSSKQYKIHEEKSDLRRSNLGYVEVNPSEDGLISESGTKNTRVSPRVAKKSHHWLPSIHEDYYGPKIHNAKHH